MGKQDRTTTQRLHVTHNAPNNMTPHTQEGLPSEISPGVCRIVITPAVSLLLQGAMYIIIAATNIVFQECNVGAIIVPSPPTRTTSFPVSYNVAGDAIIYTARPRLGQSSDEFHVQ